MRPLDIVRLIASLLICQAAGLVGAVFTTPAIPAWYAKLTKPAFTPPNWLFGPVWTGLYLMMGISLFLVWRQGAAGKQVGHALVLFGVQLLLNVVWSALFFGLRSPLLGFVEIVFLWVAILLTILSIVKVSMPAGLLLLPYIVWVSFAAVLNYSLWRLNT
jgi:benzodiazapine receptor